MLIKTCVKGYVLSLLIMIADVSIGLSQADLSYYLPDGITYNPAIPTPRSVIGHEVGEWHISHDRLVTYMKALDEASDRITLEETGRTFEGRPLLLLTITAPKNHASIESIRQQHIQLTDPSKSAGLDTRSMPAVFYMGFSIHGNEASGSNASLLTAYYLAAAQGPEIEKTLENTIILFDPSFNPDGLHRFSSWVNSRRSKLISADPLDMEHNEPWPGGRTNHYWFDLNRDWLVAQMPESQARIRQYHRWKPNVLTDHHEMGTNATFFFMPGEPSRVHPLTPEKNQDLTRRIGEYHAKALDAIGSLYYSKEGYDDFYYGKGSTFPDIQGAVGILFEQASSRGHAQESVNGILRFSFAIRNHFTTSLSSLQAIQDLRVELLNYQRDFFKSAVADAGKDPVKGIVFGSRDKTRSAMLAELLIRQQVEVYKPSSALTLNGRSYDVEGSYVVPIAQPQYRTVKAVFDKITKFKDSLFYDISSWTLPLAFGIEYDEIRATLSPGTRVAEVTYPAGKRVGGKSEYAYVIEPHGYYVPRSVNRLLRSGIRIKVANEVFHSPDGKRFERGSILIPMNGQEKGNEVIEFTMNQAAELDGLDVYAFNTGLDYQGVSLGSSSFVTLRKPEIAMVVGDGISQTDAGEMWHLLDQRYEIPVSMISIETINRANLSRYNTIIMPPGNYAAVSDAGKEKLKDWTQTGGVLIGFETALNWLTTAGLGKFEMKKADPPKDVEKSRPYSSIMDDRGAQETSGAIFEADVDLSNPLFYGYYQPKVPMFKSNNLFMERVKGTYSNPLWYGTNPLLSGYISSRNYQLLKNSSVAGLSVLGQGRVIGFADGAAFRAFWFATNRMLMNAIYHGPFLNAASAR